MQQWVATLWGAVSGCLQHCGALMGYPKGMCELQHCGPPKCSVALEGVQHCGCGVLLVWCS